MALIDDIRGMAGSIGAELKEKKGAYTLTLVVAERKAFLSKKCRQRTAVHGDAERNGLRGLRWW
jgi:hypothetical protein